MSSLPFFAAGLLLTCCAHVGAPPGRERSQLELARDQRAAGAPRQAERVLRGLHQDHPDDFEVARSLAEAIFRSGSAEPFLQELAEQNGHRDRAVNHYMAGLVRFAQTADARGGALEEFQRAIALSPGTAELHYRLGVALVESEQFEAAVPALEHAATLAPERQAIQLPLAKALARTGQKEKAVAALRRLVEGHAPPPELKVARELMDRMEDAFAGFPKAAQGRLEMGLNFLRSADLPQQAIIVFEDIAHDYPDLAVVHALLGLSYQRLDDAGRAVDEFHKASELAPGFGKNYLYLGQVYYARQRTERAKEAFEKAVSNNPFLDDAYLKLGDMALDARDLSAARKNYGLLLALEPGNTQVRTKLSSALQLDGDLTGAESTLRDGLLGAPHNVDLLLRLGLLSLDLRARAATPQERSHAAEEAARCLREVLQIQPQNALASRALQSLK